MTSVPIEILGKALAESIGVPVSRLFPHTNGGKGEERKAIRLYVKAVSWLQDSIVQDYYRLLVRVNNELRRKLNIRGHAYGRRALRVAEPARPGVTGDSGSDQVEQGARPVTVIAR